MVTKDLKNHITSAFQDPTKLRELDCRNAVFEVIEKLDKGLLRVATPSSSKEPLTSWNVQSWIKEAILLFFSIRDMKTIELGPFEFFDKIPLKKNFKDCSVRVVPPGTARYGSYLDKKVVLMPGYVNIGAYVGEGTMIDTWATVGSCAQVGKGVHLSGGVGIGGVLEPPGALPVIIEDGAFIGSRSILVEGVHIGKEAVLGANVVLTSSTRIIDVRHSSPKEHKRHIPARSVVIPGTIPKRFPAGEYQVPCALIIGERKESTDKKTSLNQALRDFGVSV